MKFIDIKKIAFYVSAVAQTVQLTASCFLKGFDGYNVELSLIWDYKRWLTNYEKKKAVKSRDLDSISQ